MPEPATAVSGACRRRLGAHQARVGVVAVMVAMLVGLVGLLTAPAASATPILRAQTAVAPHGVAAGQRVGAHEAVLAGQRRARAPGYDQMAVGSGVAPETAASGDNAASTLRHYTSQPAADSISKGGAIEPGASGKIFVTPDLYVNGADAQSRLALPITPDGFFDIPVNRILDPSLPSTVEPVYPQPGGGTEITTQAPIDVGGLPFNPFESQP